MYQTRNPRIRFVAPRRSGLGDVTSVAGNFWDMLVSSIKLEPIVGKWSFSGVLPNLDNTLNAAMSNASSAVTNLATGNLSPAQKQQIDAANIAAITQAAAGNKTLADAAVAQYKNDVAVVYAQSETQSAQANLSNLWIYGAVALGIYLVATR